MRLGRSEDHHAPTILRKDDGRADWTGTFWVGNRTDGRTNGRTDAWQTDARTDARPDSMKHLDARGVLGVTRCYRVVRCVALTAHDNQHQQHLYRGLGRQHKQYQLHLRGSTFGRTATAGGRARKDAPTLANRHRKSKNIKKTLKLLKKIYV